MISLRDFAEKAGVSRMTVSRAFSGSDKIAAATKERLVRLAEKYDFRPCAVRPSARTGRTRSIGVLCPGYGGLSYFHSIGRGIQDELLASGYLPILLTVEAENFRSCFNRLVDHRIDGIIIQSIPAQLTEQDLGYFDRHGIPAVLLNDMKGSGHDSVSTDDQMGGRMAARHLLDSGHRKIAVCISAQGFEPRVKSFLAELAKSGIPKYKTRIIRHDPGRFHDGLIQDGTTAIFAVNDLVALDLYGAAYRSGMRIPADLSIIGYANLEFCPRLSPPLTTIQQNGYMEGIEAARLVIRRLKGDKSPPQTVRVPTKLVVRESVAPPAS